jgi:MFS family permease
LTAHSPGPGDRYWRRLVLLFFFGWLLIYANRAVLSPLLTVLEAEWKMTRAQLGLLNSAFFLMYTLMQVPTGLLADRFGRRRLLLPGYLLQGVGAVASGIAPGPGSFLSARVVTGLGQSTYYATQYALASGVIPARFRALGMAIINSGMAFGIATGLLAASASLAWRGVGWRTPLVALGLLTLVLWALMTRLVRPDPVGPGAAAGATAGATNASGEARGRPVLFTRNLLLSYVVVLSSMYGFFVILTWLPYYLDVERGISGVGSGIVSAAIAFAAVPAGVMAGRLSDLLGRRRPVLLGLAPLAGVALAGIVLAPTLHWTYAAIVLYGLTGKLVLDPLVVALVADATPVAEYGTAFGILNFAGTISTVLAPAVTGHIADLTGSFRSAFLLAAGLQALAFVCLVAMRAERRVLG